MYKLRVVTVTAIITMFLVLTVHNLGALTVTFMIRSGVCLQEWIDFFSGEVMMHPVTNRPMDKRSFIPSKWEKLKVIMCVHQEGNMCVS